MLSKIAAVAHSKVALAVLGAVLVGGGGGAVAMAATTGHLSTLGVNLAAQGSSTDSHAHTTSVEGLLTACSATTTPATISVKDSAGKSWTFVVSATTKINGDTHTNASHGDSSASKTTGAGASSAKGDNSTHAGDNTTGTDASSAKGDNSTHGGDNTSTGASSAKGANSADAGDSSAHTTTLADVCTTANIGTRDVQVQATRNGASYDAWKVTLQGAGSASGDSSDGHGSGSGSNSSSSDSSSN